MDSIEQSEKKHNFFSIFLIVIYILSFCAMFLSYRTRAVPFGPFLLEGTPAIAFIAAFQAILLALIIGLIRRTSWAFVAILVYQSYGLLKSLAEKIFFSKNADALIASALDKSPENPMLSKGDMLALMKVVANVSFVFSILFAGLLILFIFLARKCFEKDRAI
jgi:hypothetical protein